MKGERLKEDLKLRSFFTLDGGLGNGLALCLAANAFEARQFVRVF